MDSRPDPCPARTDDGCWSNNLSLFVATSPGDNKGGPLLFHGGRVSIGRTSGLAPRQFGWRQPSEGSSRGLGSPPCPATSA